MSTQSLLDWLWGQCRCEYLSQLYDLSPQNPLARVAAKNLSGICADRFAAAQWAEAIRYLSAGRCDSTGENADVLYLRLLDYLAPSGIDS